MEKQELDIRAIVHALRRRWWVLAVSVLVGLVAGVALSNLIGDEFKATALVTVDHADTQAADDQIETQAELAHSPGVALPVADELGLASDDVDGLLDLYTVEPLTNGILAFEATDTSGGGAAALANALAAEYVDQHNAEIEEEATRRLDFLEARESSIQTQLDETIEAIGTVPLVPDEGVPPQLDILQNQFNRLSNQLAEVQGQIGNLSLEPGDQTRVTSPALAPASAATPGPVLYVLLGALGGLVLGLAAVVLTEMIGQKVRRRDDIAGAAGAPVLVSTSLPGRGSHRRRLARALRHPFHDHGRLSRVATTITDTLLDGTSRSALLIASVDCDAEAALVAVNTADALRHDDCDVTIKELTPSRSDVIARLVTLLDHRTGDAEDRQGPLVQWEPYTNFDIDVDDVAKRAAERRNGGKRQLAGRDQASASVVIGYVSTLQDTEDEAPMLALDDQENLGSLLVVVAGRTTASTVRLVSERLSRAGAPVLAVAVISPDRFDDTSGWIGAEPQSSARQRIET